MPDPKLPTPQESTQNVITPDGNIIQQQNVAPQIDKVQPTSEPAVDSTKDETAVIPLVDDKGKEGDSEILDFNSFLDESGGNKKLDATPREDKPAKEKSEPATPAVPLPAKEVVVTDKKDKNWRDVTTIEDKELADLLVKDVSKKAFDKIIPLVQEHKKLKSELADKDKTLTLTANQLKTLKESGPQLPDSYYEHENGYLLDPHFKTVASNVQDAQVILNHWREQQNKVAEGATEIEIMQLNPKTQEYEITGKVPADRKAEMNLNNYVAYAHNAFNNAQVEAQTFIKGFRNRVGESSKAINEMRQSMFSNLYTPENKPIYEPAVRQTLESFPASYRNTPVAVLAAEALVMGNVIGKLLIDANEKIKAFSTNGAAGTTNGVATSKPASSAAGPSSAEAAGDGGIPNKGGKKDDISFDDFKKETE